MSEDEDYDELPRISVNSSDQTFSTFAMPSAEEVASQRAREFDIERQLCQLRAADAVQTLPLSNSDSSGSEGEVLLAAVDALTVRPARAPPPSALVLLAALARAAPAPARDTLRAHADTLRADDEWQRVARIDHTVRQVAGALRACGACADAEALCAGALLVVGAVARESRAARVAARALHQLLDHVAAPAQVRQLAELVAGAVSDAEIRLALSDTVSSGAGGGADALAERLLNVVLADLLDASWNTGALGEEILAELVRTAARRAHGEVLVAALGRALAARASHDGVMRARLLAALAPPARRHQPHHDKLEVLVGASKLRLLFRGAEDERAPGPSGAK